MAHAVCDTRPAAAGCNLDGDQLAQVRAVIDQGQEPVAAQLIDDVGSRPLGAVDGDRLAVPFQDAVAIVLEADGQLTLNRLHGGRFCPGTAQALAIAVLIDGAAERADRAVVAAGAVLTRCGQPLGCAVGGVVERGDVHDVLLTFDQVTAPRFIGIPPPAIVRIAVLGPRVAGVGQQDGESGNDQLALHGIPP